MNHIQTINQSLLRRTVIEVASLPEDDLAIVLDVVTFLKQQRSAETAGDIRQAARQRAKALRALPRSQLVAQLHEVGERIRGQVVAGGLAVDGDWEGD